MTESVLSPQHYTDGGIETIDYLRAKLTPAEFSGYCRGNVLKYLSRAGKKTDDEINDYLKAQVYLAWLIEAQKSPGITGEPLDKRV